MKLNFLYFIFVIFFTSYVNCQSYDTVELIKKYGYKAESHTVQTSDGFSLIIHRVVPKNTTNYIGKKYPCLLMHGAIDSSVEFFQLQNDSLPFILSEEGFDVYLGNNRGNQYSFHAKYNRTTSDFWDFSWHEMGIYDLSSTIDFVLNKTGAEKLNYYGIYQGTSIAMVLLSMKPEYNQKIHQVHIPSPVIFMGQFSNFPLIGPATLYMDAFSRNNMLDMSVFMNSALPITDSNFNLGTMHSSVMLHFLVSGGNPFQYSADLNANKEFFRFKTPYGSKKSYLHYIQIVGSGKFRQYDYGASNMKKYGTAEPPNYDLSKVTAPVFIYRGEYDRYVGEEDIKTLKKHLPNVVHDEIIKNFNHFDYQISRLAKDAIYVKVANIMSLENYQPTTTQAPQTLIQSFFGGIANLLLRN